MTLIEDKSIYKSSKTETGEIYLCLRLQVWEVVCQIGMVEATEACAVFKLGEIMIFMNELLFGLN